jgi:DNA (cytosine-5)-methyltransferase 1
MAFEEAGFCVVRGPDLLWGGDVRRFHPPIGKFDGVIGGPPCKGESTLAHLNGKPGQSMAEEFFRCVEEARPKWWLMEAVVRHGTPITPPGSHVVALSPRWLGEKQSRKRYFHSNLNLEPHLEVALFEHPEFKHAVLAGHGGAYGSVVRGMAKYPWAEHCELQGLPPDFNLPGFTVTAKYEAVGNGVPLSMGRAIANAVRLVVPEGV